MSTAQEISRQFIQLLKEQDAYPLLPEIVDLLEAEAYRNQDIQVVAAVGLEEKERRDLEKTLVAKWGEHRFIYSTDPALVSGLVIKFQHQVIDLSGRRALRDLKSSLT